MTDKTPQSVKEEVPEEGKAYPDLKSMPPNVLAGRVVSSLIMAKGNIATWQGIIEKMLETIRDEYAALQSLDEKGGDLPDRYNDRSYCKALEQERDFLRTQLKSMTDIAIGTAKELAEIKHTQPATRAPDTVGDGWQPIRKGTL